MTVRLPLAGLAEAAAILGVSDARVGQLRRQDPAFPVPLDTVAAGAIWLRAELQAYATARTKGKPGRPPKHPT